MSSAGTDEAAADTAERYYRAMVAGDAGALRHLFDERAPIAGVHEGALLWLTLEEFIAEAQGLVGQHGAETCAVESLRVDGDMATVAVRGRYAGAVYVDHLAMIRVDGRWRIAGKTFHAVG